jgi:iron(III) transport system permease protein
MKDRWFSVAERAIVSLFLAAALLPVVFIVVEAARTVTGARLFGFSGLPRGFGYYTLKVTWNSLALAGAVIILALGLGIPAGIILARVALPLRRFWLFLLALPLAAPSLVTAIAIREALDRAGPLAGLVRNLGLGSVSAYGFWGLSLSHLSHALPYTILLVSAGCIAVPRDLEEQAFSLGAGRPAAVHRILLPYLFPHILAAGTMTLLFSLGDLGAPLVLGGGYKVFALEMYVNFISNWGDKRIPALFGLWASLLFFAVLLFVAQVDRRLTARAQRGVPVQPDGRPGAKIAGTFYVALLALVLAYPYVHIFAGAAVAPATSAVPGAALGSAAAASAAARLAAGVLAMEWKPLGSSLLIAGLAAPLAIGAAVFITDWLKSRKRGILIPGLILSPAIIPGVIFGFGYLEVFKVLRVPGSGAFWQLALLVLVLAARSVPFIVIILQSAFNSATIPHEESARSLGASRAASFFTVLLPQIKPFIAVALVVSIFTTITELAATLVLYPPGWRTMAVYVAYYMEEGLFSKAVGMALLMLLVVEASVLAAGPLLRANSVARQLFLSPFSMLNLDIPREKRKADMRVNTSAAGLLKSLRARMRLRLRMRRPAIAAGMAHAAGKDPGAAAGLGPGMAAGSIVPGSEREEIARLRQELARMELKLLGMQINPHFFFNTLNTIVHLIGADRDAAIATVGKLSSLFRYSLDASEAMHVPFAKEMEYLRTYLEIEKLRFGDKLSFSLDIPLEVMDDPIHPLLIQPIVENAVRYGKDEAGRAYVTLKAWREKPGTLVIQVRDYGALRFDPGLAEKAQGTGIRNVRRRMMNLYGEDLEFSRNQPQGLAVTMRIRSGGERR